MPFENDWVYKRFLDGPPKETVKQTIEEWVEENRYVAGADIKDRVLAAVAILRVHPTEQDARRSFMLENGLLHPDIDSPICAGCGARLASGGYFINGQDYCTNDECVKKGLV
jgi:hypothetical protein